MRREYSGARTLANHGKTPLGLRDPSGFGSTVNGLDRVWRSEGHGGRKRRPPAEGSEALKAAAQLNLLASQLRNRPFWDKRGLSL